MAIRRALGAGLTALFALVVAGPSTAEPLLVDRVVALVDGRPILFSELRSRARPFLARQKDAPAWQRAATLRSILRDLLERRIDEALLDALAKRHGLDVSETEVERALGEIARENQLTRAGILAAALDSGYPEREYRGELRRQLLERKVLVREADRRRERAPDGADAAKWWAALARRVLAEARSEACVERRARF